MANKVQLVPVTGVFSIPFYGVEVEMGGEWQLVHVDISRQQVIRWMQQNDYLAYSEGALHYSRRERRVMPKILEKPPEPEIVTPPETKAPEIPILDPLEELAGQLLQGG